MVIEKSKSEIRQEIKSLLKTKLNGDLQFRQNQSQLICQKLLSDNYFMEANMIFSYMPMNSEVDIIPFMFSALEQKKTLLVPKVISGTSQMDFYFINKNQLLNSMETGSFGIFEPDDSCKKFQFSQLTQTEKETKILFVVPGLSFTKDGKRLGRGKGFYDIYLEKVEKQIININPKVQLKKVGVCFDFQLMDYLPVESNDVLMDKVIF